MSIIGSSYALANDDWLLGMDQEIGAMLLQGLFIRDLMFFWRGIEDATKYMGEDNMMITISVGSHLPLVTGVAWGMKLDNADSIITVYFGDGDSSTGAVHEAMNFAGVLEVPTMFLPEQPVRYLDDLREAIRVEH